MDYSMILINREDLREEVAQIASWGVNSSIKDHLQCKPTLVKNNKIL